MSNRDHRGGASNAPQDTRTRRPQNQNQNQNGHAADTAEVVPATTPSEPAIANEMLIRQEAYLLYEQSGCVDGHDLEHWLAAEGRLRGTAPDSATALEAPTKPARRHRHARS